MRNVRRGMRSGFTLVEMMIVVAIIAILAGMAVPQFMKNMRKSETSEAIRLMKQIADAEGTFYSIHNKRYVADDGTGDGIKKLGITVNDTGDFKYFKIQSCSDGSGTAGSDTGTGKGVIITASTDSGFATDKTVYMFYPKGLINLTDDNAKDYYEGSAYMYDYINSETSIGTNAPTCTDE